MIAAAFRSRVGGRSPEYAAPHGASPGVTDPHDDAGRVIPSAGAGDRERLSPADGPRSNSKESTMRMVLARARHRAVTGDPSADGPTEVHAYEVVEGTDKWVSVCGTNSISPDDVKEVEAFSSSPCLACWGVFILSSNVEPVERDERPTRVIEAEPVRVSAVQRYAMSWRGPFVHLVTPDAVMGKVDDRTHVVGLCGGIGTPLPGRGGYPVCEGCAQWLR
ncbi:hypothetical protein REH65_31405 [Saccharopolyspora sp. ID03-671]|uniref:hypothetical protein n=1 Tax=Saccharopolyspora sp. ID03-671 TaxID=3073066 RepID=UPI0032569333